MSNDAWCLIPPHILEREDLSSTEMLLFGRIMGLSGKYGYCFASNQFLGEQLRLSANRISHLVNILNAKKLITIVTNGYQRKIYPDFIVAENNKGVAENNTPPLLKITTIDKEISKKDLNKELNKDFRSISEETLQETNFEDSCLSEKEKAFDEFWGLYPSRKGKKLHKTDARKNFMRLKSADLALILHAVGNYAVSKTVTDGFAMDAVRFIKKDNWREWLEPEEQTKKGGNNEQRFAFSASV